MNWKFAGDRPVYQQIMAAIRGAILKGELPPGGKVPSVRDLAAQAQVNPNTMQRALTELEREGLLVSGGTSAYIVKILREAGAREVHMRVSSPPFLYPCYFGTDISSKNNLIAREMDLEQIRRHLDVDSLGYLSIEGVRSIAGNSRLGICDACFSGNYPIPVSEEHREDKFSKKLEK